MTDREAMQKALDALELLAWYENPATKVQVRKPRNGGPIVTMYPHKVATEAAAPLRERLAQPEQEPVAWAHKEGLEAIKDFDASIYANGGFDDAVPLYTTPPQRKPLTEKRIVELYSFWVVDCQDIVGFARAVERTVKGEA